MLRIHRPQAALAARLVVGSHHHPLLGEPVGAARSSIPPARQYLPTGYRCSRGGAHEVDSHGSVPACPAGKALTSIIIAHSIPESTPGRENPNE